MPVFYFAQKRYVVYFLSTFVFTATAVHRLMVVRSQTPLAACPVARADHTSQGVSCINSKLHIKM